jgi:excisionase family DNA binding protein
MRSLSADTTPMLIAADEMANLLGVSERTLWRLLSAGKVPRPVRIGRSTRWRAAEVKQWIENDCPPLTRHRL